MSLIIFAIIFIFLFASGTGISALIGLLTCGKPVISLALIEGLWWATPIWLVFFLLHFDYTSPYILPIFQDPFNSEILGTVYAMLLITCVATARMYHTTDVAMCVQSKDEARAFQEALAKSLKEKEKEKENSSTK